MQQLHFFAAICWDVKKKQFLLHQHTFWSSNMFTVSKFKFVLMFVQHSIISLPTRQCNVWKAASPVHSLEAILKSHTSLCCNQERRESCKFWRILCDRLCVQQDDIWGANYHIAAGVSPNQTSIYNYNHGCWTSSVTMFQWWMTTQANEQTRG